MEKKQIVCIGASLVDETFTCTSTPLQGTSNPARYDRSPGGVSRNIANHLACLGLPVELISHFGKDSDGNWLMEQCTSAGIQIKHSLFNNSSTGKYVALLSPDGELFTGAASSEFEELVTPQFLDSKSTLFKKAALIQFDCNLSRESINWLLSFCLQENIPSIIEPVSIVKASRLLHADLTNVLLITPNLDELMALTEGVDNTNQDKLINLLLEKGVKNLWLRNGKNGSTIYSTNYKFNLPAFETKVIDITGAGDAALAGWVYAFLKNKNPEDCLRYGHAMASLILQVVGAIHPELTAALLENTFEKHNK